MNENDQQTVTNDAQDSAEQQAETWETWLGKLPDDQRATVSTLYEAHTQGLRKALQSERESRSDLERQLRAAAKAAGKDSEAEKQLTTMADDLEKANRRADFFAEASKPEIGLLNPKAAWALANADPERFFDRKGNLRLDALKAEYPEQFGRSGVPRANAGNGAGQGGSDKADMNAFIRSRAGRG